MSLFAKIDPEDSRSSAGQPLAERMRPGRWMNLQDRNRCSGRENRCARRLNGTILAR